jgi:Zn-finger nucleic acid-binding protein
MDCPVCKVPLIAVEREQVEVDYCISCRGLWFDQGELAILAEKLQTPINIEALFGREATTSEKPRNCPRCGKKMQKNELAASTRVITDHCPASEGIWFDSSELGALLDHATQSAGSTRPVATFLGEMFGRRS